MNTQLSLFEEPQTTVSKTYLRDRSGKFATKMQAETDRAKRDADYYKFKYEQEQRKNAPILARLIKIERELQSLNNK